ncbi:MAG: hypothetical protein GY755_16120 [Chloroflexi bacterium]|nr:hypothetical protein [Chloroflexota bacterium]
MKHSNTQGKLLTGARQTMLSWVKVIKNFDELPDAYKNSVDELLGDLQKFPYTIFAPPMSSSRFESTEKLVLWLNETLYVLEEKDEQIELTGYPNKMIGHLEVGNVLLYSWISVSGITATGDIAVSTITYNAATHRHVQPFLENIRSLPAKKDKAKIERPELDYLAPLNFKFFNFALNSLKGNEKVFASVWQPEISNSIVPLFKSAFKRLVTPAHLAILTDQEIIFIEDDHRSIEMKGKRYGGIWRYIPRKSILAVGLIERKDDCLCLSCKIKPDLLIERIFEAEVRDQVLKLKTELESSMGM